MSIGLLLVKLVGLSIVWAGCWFTNLEETPWTVANSYLHLTNDWLGNEPWHSYSVVSYGQINHVILLHEWEFATINSVTICNVSDLAAQTCQFILYMYMYIYVIGQIPIQINFILN